MSYGVVANPRALEPLRPVAPDGYYLDDFAVLCPEHGEVATGLLDFDAAAVAFANHALAFHVEAYMNKGVDVQLTIQWDETRIPGDDYCI